MTSAAPRQRPGRPPIRRGHTHDLGTIAGAKFSGKSGQAIAKPWRPLARPDRPPLRRGRTQDYGPVRTWLPEKVKRSDLPASTRVIGSRFHYKIKRHSAGKHKTLVKRLKVQVVVQGQHMSKDKGDFKDAFGPQGPSYIYDDSRAVICMAENSSNRKGARHIDTREHFVDQLVKNRFFVGASAAILLALELLPCSCCAASPLV